MNTFLMSTKDNTNLVVKHCSLAAVLCISAYTFINTISIRDTSTSIYILRISISLPAFLFSSVSYFLLIVCYLCIDCRSFVLKSLHDIEWNKNNTLYSYNSEMQYLKKHQQQQAIWNAFYRFDRFYFHLFYTSYTFYIWFQIEILWKNNTNELLKAKQWQQQQHSKRFTKYTIQLLLLLASQLKRKFWVSRLIIYCLFIYLFIIRSTAVNIVAKYYEKKDRYCHRIE